MNRKDSRLLRGPLPGEILDRKLIPDRLHTKPKGFSVLVRFIKRWLGRA